MQRIKTVIMGAAGRDFHNFNTIYRDNREYDVVAFTATQISEYRRPQVPGVAGRPPLPGRASPSSPRPSSRRPHRASTGCDEVVFAYSDVSHDYVMSRGSVVRPPAPTSCSSAPAPR